MRTKVRSLACGVFVLLAALTASAQAAETRTINGCSVRSGALCSGLNLQGAKLSGSDLTYSDFTGSDLSGADLSGANLTNANMDRSISLTRTSVERFWTRQICRALNFFERSSTTLG